MSGNIGKRSWLPVSLLIVVSLLLTACGAPSAAPAAPAAAPTSAPTAPAPAATTAMTTTAAAPAATTAMTTTAAAPAATTAMTTTAAAPAATTAMTTTAATPAATTAMTTTAATPAAVAAGSKGTIVFIPKSTSATFYLFLVKGAQDKAKELGYTIDYQGPATEADIASQVDLVRNNTSKKPAGILLAALDSKALIPPVEEAIKAGVPVVMVDSGIDSTAPVASITTDNYKGGTMAGDEMVKELGGKGTVADLGIQAGSVSSQRSKGFDDVIAKAAGMKVLPTQWTDADAAKSLNIATDLITGNPTLAGIFCAAAPIASGAAQAAKAKGLDKKVKIITFDPSPEILPLMQDGTINAIIAQDPYQMGYQGVAAIDAFIKGQKIANPNIQLPPVLITPDNYNTPEVQKLLQTPDKFQK
jgi:ribose transport system substrate-binding protein